MLFLCVSVYCHRVTTQLQLINIYIYIYPPSGPHRACNGITLPLYLFSNIRCLFGIRDFMFRSEQYAVMQDCRLSSPFPASTQTSYMNIIECGSTITNIIWTNCVSKPVPHVDEFLVLKFGWIPTALIKALHFPFILSWKIKWHHQIPRPVSGCSKLFVNKSRVNGIAVSNTVHNLYNKMSLCFVACIHFYGSVGVTTDSSEFFSCVVQRFVSVVFRNLMSAEAL